MKSKKVLTYIAVSLVVVLIIGGLGYITSGFKDWEFWKKDAWPVTYDLNDFEIYESDRDIDMMYVDGEVKLGLSDIHDEDKSIIVKLTSDKANLNEEYIMQYEVLTDDMVCFRLLISDIELDDHDLYSFVFFIVDYEDIDLDDAIDLYKYDTGFVFYFFSFNDDKLPDDIKITLSLIELEALEIKGLDISDDYVLTWTENEDVFEYIITIDKDEYIVNNNVFNLLSYLDVGDNSITIQAVPFPYSKYTVSVVKEIEVDYVLDDVEVDNRVLALEDLLVSDGTKAGVLGADTNTEITGSNCISFMLVDVGIFGDDIIFYMFYAKDDGIISLDVHQKIELIAGEYVLFVDTDVDFESIEPSVFLDDLTSDNKLVVEHGGETYIISGFVFEE